MNFIKYKLMLMVLIFIISLEATDFTPFLGSKRGERLREISREIRISQKKDIHSFLKKEANKSSILRKK